MTILKDEATPTRSVAVPLPPDVIAIVPVRNLVLFPGVLSPLSMGRVKSIAAVEDAVQARRQIGLILQRDPTENTPGGKDLFAIGTIANIARRRASGDGR